MHILRERVLSIYVLYELGFKTRFSNTGLCISPQILQRLITWLEHIRLFRCLITYTYDLVL